MATNRFATFRSFLIDGFQYTTPHHYVSGLSQNSGSWRRSDDSRKLVLIRHHQPGMLTTTTQLSQSLIGKPYRTRKHFL
ncbi:hypothetical protein [Lactiplantibacillus argentoratensis]|uniref:hypothetical protein n=1 Tax=Lactiplantibacillus argentoratensis TaxID=271881 RepID=UPI00128E6E2A|nr:hypothetical protein [Lactiplantibacillus argentoratensis]